MDDAFNQRFIAAAREELGTRFHHQGRLPKVALDCAGLVVVAARAAGHDAVDNNKYGRRPLAAEMLAVLHAQCDFVPLTSMRVGDILLFKFDANPQHLAILVGFEESSGRPIIIHAHQPKGMVIEHAVADAFLSHLHGCFRIRPQQPTEA